MAPPKGNTYGVGHGCPQKYDREKLAESLDRWSLKEDSIHLAAWAFLEEDLPCHTYINRFASESDAFAKAHKKAKFRIAQRLKDKLHDKKNPYNYGVYMREIPMYDDMLHAFERAEKVFDAELRKQSPSEESKGDIKELASAIREIASESKANSQHSDKQ